MDVIAMEDYVAKDERPLQKCLDDIVSSDVYVGIFAWRYGYIPNDKSENQSNLSITELEYRKAKEKGIPCLIFLLSEEIGWPPRYIDGMGPSGIVGNDNIDRLRKELAQTHTVSFFKNKDELAAKVLAAANRFLNEVNEEILEPSIEKILRFVGEKQFFVGRDEYINKIIKDVLNPGCRITIVGPGGSGKSQLAFKGSSSILRNGKYR